VRGRVNPVLTQTGWQQMRNAAALDEQHTPSPGTPAWTHIITSPLLRCREFAERSAASAGLSAAIIDDWQEIDYGDWDGMPAAEWRKVAADQFRAFREDITALAPPNGESFIQFRDRVLSAWNRLAEFDHGSHLLVVTHGGVLRVVLPHVLGMPANRSFPLHIPFACYSRVQLEVEDAGQEEGDGKHRKLHASLVFHNGAEHGASF